jgi:hypothetical protein
MRPRALGTRFLIVSALAALASPARAQAPSGPFAGLFGRQARTGQTLDLRGSLFGLYQKVDVPEDAELTLDPRFQKTSALGGTSGTLVYGYRRSTPVTTMGSSSFSFSGTGTIADYSTNANLPTYGFGLGTALTKSTQKVSFTSSASGSYSSTYVAPLQSGSGAVDLGGGSTLLQPLFSVGPDVPSYGGTAGASVSAKLSRKVTFTASASGSYSSLYSFTPIQPVASSDPAQPLTGGGLASAAEPIVTTRASSGLTDSLTKSSSFSVFGDWTQSRIVNGSADNTANGIAGNLTTLGVRAVFSQQIAKGLGFHLGYGHTVTQYQNAPSTESDNIDAGIDYNRGGTIALGPRTTITFATSTALITTADRNGGGSQTHFRVNGNAGIARRLGRTWSASLTYVRGLGYDAGFSDPILSDSVTGSFGGLLAPRTNFSSSASWTRNQVGFGGDAFGGYSATSALNVGIIRSVGAYAQYTYFGYTVPPSTAALNILSNFSRQTVSVGLNLWVPIITGRARS